MDRERVQELVRELLAAIGEDPTRAGLVETPRRVADMYAELFEGAESDPGQHLTVTFEEGHDEMVMVRDIPFTSLCEHHLVPFTGLAHLAYLPGPEGRITAVEFDATLADAASASAARSEFSCSVSASSRPALSRSWTRPSPPFRPTACCWSRCC